MVTRSKWLARLAAMATLALLASMLTPALVSAQVTISPEVNNLILNEGDTLVEVLTVTIPPGEGITKADVYLLADTTGSMFGPIGAVKAGASDIVDGLIAALPSVDLRFGAGDYKDFPHDPYAFNHAQSITSDTVAVKVAINGWFASGGADGPEGQFFAYDQIADDVDPAGGSIGWRSDAKRILVTFGDAPGHDPVCAAISGLPYDITEASVTAKLVGAGTTYIGISTGTGFPAGLDDNPTLGGDYVAACGAPGGMAGQATRIADTTGGTHVTGVNSGTIVATIVDLITSAVTTVNNLELQPTGAIAPFVSSISPASVGPLPGDEEHVVDFTVNWVGAVACDATDQVYTGTIDVVADGVVVAHKDVTITVPKCIVEVEIDVKPGSDPSSINCNNPNMTVPVAIFSDPASGFDATLIDWANTGFGPNGALEEHGKVHAEDKNGDGVLDAVMHFKLGDTGLTCDDTHATITGVTTDGLAFTGTGDIRMVQGGKGRP